MEGRGGREWRVKRRLLLLLHWDITAQVKYRNTGLLPSPLFSPTGQRKDAETSLMRNLGGVGRVGDVEFS